MNLHVELDEAALERLADKLAPRVAQLLGAQQSGDGYLRGAQAAADYLGCSRDRIYELVEQNRVEFRKDGLQPAPGARDRRPLMFRREWLDAALDHAVR